MLTNMGSKQKLKSEESNFQRSLVLDHGISKKEIVTNLPSSTFSV